MLNGEDVFTVEVDCKRSIGDTKISRSHFIEIARKNKESVENGNEVAQKGKRECGQELPRNNSLSKW